MGEREEEDCLIFTRGYEGGRKISVIIYNDEENGKLEIEKIHMTGPDFEAISVVAFDEENEMFKGKNPVANIQQGRKTWIYFDDGSCVDPEQIKNIAKLFQAKRKSEKQ